MHGDRGTSLIELMVGMTLMVVFLAMFTGAVVMMNNAMNKSQAVNLTATQLNGAFTSLDSTVRYAAFISTPAVGTSGDWYVEMRTTTTGAEVCSQLRVDIQAQQLQSRTWVVANGAAGSPTAWEPISSGISNGAAAPGASTQPFYLVPVAANAVLQQLTVNLSAPAGFGTAQTVSRASFTFSAANSVVPAPSGPICQQQGRP